MKNRTLTSLFLTVALVAALPAVAGGDANLLIGAKTVDDDTLDFAGVDAQAQFGVALTLDFDWPVDLAFDLFSSSDSASTTVMAGTPINYATSVNTKELGVGVRKLWGDRAKPYLGAGLAWLHLEASQSMSGTLSGGGTFNTLLINDGGSAVGIWLNAGLLYRVTDSFNLGFDLRNSNADVDLTTASGPVQSEIGAGGTQYAVVVGYHW